jgi:hypothetical protein
MKKVFITIVLLTLAISSFAQEKDVTKFLGIPVDGTKAEMIAKLKEKGFTSTVRDKDILEGEFNGNDVHIYIGTNNNKVCRIMVCDKNYISETDIKIRFNNLCHQFKNSNKYISATEFTIPEDEDISYEMSVNNKRYYAMFFQTSKEEYESEREKLLKNEYLTDEMKTTQHQNILKKIGNKVVWFYISEYYGEYYITMYYDNELNKANGEDL